MSRKPFVPGLLLWMAFFLAGCNEVLSIPSVRLSADGKRMAFLVQTNAGQSLSLQSLSLEDGSVERVGASNAMQGAFDWNPGQTALAFVEIAPDESSSIQLVQFSDGQSPSMLAALPGNVWVNQIAYSPDGSQIALSVSLLPPGTKPSQVLDSSTDLNGSEAQVLLLDVASGELTKIVGDDVVDTPSLAWNADGTRLAYAYDSRVFVYNVADGQSVTVNWADDLSLHSPSWLDNTTLIMVSTPDSSQQGASQTEIVSYDVTSSRTHSWLVGAGVAVVSASPDGRYIAYIEGQPSSDPQVSSGGYATATTNVMLLPVDQTGGQAIYVGVSLDKPVWSSDSQTLYISNANAFSMFAGNRRQIFAVDIASGAVTPIFEGPLATSSLLGWSPPQQATPTP